MSESKVQILRTEFQGLEKLLTDRFDQTEKHVDEKFKQMLNRLEEMKTLSKGTDELLRGKNGNPGMNGRLKSCGKDAEDISVGIKHSYDWFFWHSRRFCCQVP